MISKGASIGLALLAAAFSMVAPRSAAAQDYPWCVASQHGAAQHCLFRTKEQCDAVGGNHLPVTPWMLHVWTAPGCESPQGVFSHENPRLTCADGRTIAADDVANAVATAAVAYPQSGTVSVPGIALAPVLTDDRASQLGITERISSFTQEFPYAAYRVQNIGQAARYVDGTVLMPGEVFSMNDTIKERTPENGYTEGFVIGPGGVFREDLGGGVSTATTAVWTAAYFAGMEAVQVQAHSIYIPRYAPGLEATVAWGVFDMQFRNSLPNAVLITARTTNTSVTVEFWGTRQFDKVKAIFGPKRDVVPYATVADTSASCLGQEGSSGFTIDVERRFISEREVVRSETTTTTYRPAPRVICA